MVFSKTLKTIATRYGTPVYVVFEEQIKKYAKLVQKHAAKNNISVFYAVKAYPRKFVCRLLNKHFGFGVEAASLGEMMLAIYSGVNPEKIIFNSNAKSEEEIYFALNKNIYYLNCDSIDQFELIEKIAHKLNKRPKVMLRYNPNVNPKVHPYIATSLQENKFGMFEKEINTILAGYSKNSNTDIIGLHIHLGSNIKEEEVFEEGFMKTKNYIKKHKDKIKFSTINIGGGFGVSYVKDKSDINIGNIFARAREIFPDLKILTEPGRFLAAKSAYLVGKVLSLKQTPYKNFVVIDAAMTENIRPALYNAVHPIYTLYNSDKKIKCDIVSVVCESSDFQAKNITIPEPEVGDFIAIGNVGAYSIAMASNYNSRTRPPEILIKKSGLIAKIVPREKVRDIIDREK